MTRITQPSSLSSLPSDLDLCPDRGPEQWHRLYSLARSEAVRLRQEAINRFWRDLGSEVLRIVAFGQHSGRRLEISGNTLRSSGSL